MVMITDVEDKTILLVTWEIDEPSDLIWDLKEVTGYKCEGYVVITDATMDALEEYSNELDFYDLETVGISDGKLNIIDSDIIKANFSKVWNKITRKLAELNDK